MIRYELICARGHEFSGWFQNSAAFDREKKAGRLACVFCNSTKISKAIMAPHIASGAKAVPKRTEQAERATHGERAEQAEQKERAEQKEHHAIDADEVARALQEISAHVEAHFEDVGEDFAEEARAIHYGEVTARNIYGEASADETTALQEEGVPFYTMPAFMPKKKRH